MIKMSKYNLLTNTFTVWMCSTVAVIVLYSSGGGACLAGGKELRLYQLIRQWRGSVCGH